MNGHSATAEMLLRFYGTGSKRDFGQVLGVFVRRPYDSLARDLRGVIGHAAIEHTDPNDEVAFTYEFEHYVLRLSMVGPYATLFRTEAGSDRSVPLQVPANDLERAIVVCIGAHGFMLMNRSALEQEIDLWGDEPPSALYHLLFVSGGRMPWY